MTLMMLVFWGLLIVGGIALWQTTRGDRPLPPDALLPTSAPDPDRLLDERFARGEIDLDDYQKRRDVLRAGR